MHLEVAECVVALVVYHIEQRGNLGESIAHECKHFFKLRHLLVGGYLGLQEQHNLARGGGTQHNVTQHARLRAQVEERHALAVGKIPYCVAQAVVQVAHKGTLLYVEHLVECTGDVETQRVHIIIRHALRHLFPGEPTLVAKCKFEFVSIGTGIFRAQYRHHIGQLHLAYAGEGIHHLLLLVFKLMFVSQALPFATAAHTIMFAEGCGTLGRICVEFHSLGLGITVFLAPYLQIDHIAGYHIGHKHHHIIHTRQRFTLGCHACYLYLLQQRELFFLSCHFVAYFSLSAKLHLISRLSAFLTQ